MGLKSVFAAVVCTGFLALGGVAMADEYRPSQFLGLDLSKAVLSPKRRGPEAEFPAVPIEARSDRAQADPDASVWPELPARNIHVAKTRTAKAGTAKAGIAKTRIVRPQIAASSAKPPRGAARTKL